MVEQPEVSSSWLLSVLPSGASGRDLRGGKERSEGDEIEQSNFFHFHTVFSTKYFMTCLNHSQTKKPETFLKFFNLFGLSRIQMIKLFCKTITWSELINPRFTLTCPMLSVGAE